MVSTLLLFLVVNPLPNTNAVLQLNNGDVVTVSVIEKYFELNTIYGKLKIPTTDVKSIHLSLRTSDIVNKIISSEITNLSSKNFQDRERAEEQLIKFGNYAYRPVGELLKSKDQEVTLRANRIIKTINSKFNNLNMFTEDTIETKRFTISGSLENSKFAVKNIYFGETQVSFDSLRSIEFECNKPLFISAEYVGADTWFNTNLYFNKGDKIILSAKGEVDLWPQTPRQYLSKPNGINNIENNTEYRPGILLGKIGEEIFVVGEKYNNIAKLNGELYLRIAQSPWGIKCIGGYYVSYEK